ncbi:MAG: hypothetical protein U1G07_12420 [Verrucomicrobiota bacterium]
MNIFTSRERFCPTGVTHGAGPESRSTLRPRPLFDPFGEVAAQVTDKGHPVTYPNNPRAFACVDAKALFDFDQAY